MSRAWLRQRERGSVFAMRLIAGIALHIGRGPARALLYPICLYFVLASPSARRASRRYLARVFARAPRWREVFRHHFYFAATLLDRVYLWAGQCERFAVSKQGAEVVRALNAQGRGCLLLGAHMGSFELTRACGARARGLNISMLMYRANTPKLNAAMASLGAAQPLRAIPIGDFDSLLIAKARVDAGEWLGILGDRVHGGEKVVTVPFFGQPVTLPAGPFMLAKALKIPVVLFFSLYRGGNVYEEHFELLADEIRFSTRRGEAEIAQWATRYAERLEHYCRLAPYNWFNFFDYWGDEAGEENAAIATAADGERVDARP